MTAAAIGIVVFLVLGLPLLAWATGTWLPATRSGPGPQDPDLTFAREHGVRGLDFVRVQEAVAHGRAAPAPLRAAAAANRPDPLLPRTAGADAGRMGGWI